MNRRYSIGGGGKSSYSKGLSDFNCRNFINYCHALCKKAIAFTLAETLIVMGIIGVVAALTLPNLNSSTGDKEKVVKVKKIYSNLNDALGRATAVYGPVEDWGSSQTKVGDRLTEFMKLSKNCKMTKGCYNKGSGNSSYYEFILSDGTSAYISPRGLGNFGVTFDIDGLNKGKNQAGYDIFEVVTTDGNFNIQYPDYEFGLLKHYLFECKYPEPAMQWVMAFDNMDYLKVDSSGKCPDGKTILDGTTNTSCK